MSEIRLYQLAAQHRGLEALADAGDMPEEVIRDTLEGLEGDIADKVRSVAHMIRHLETIAKAIKDEAKAMQDRASRVQNRADSVREYLLFNMLAMNKSKLDYPEFSVAVRDNPVAVVLEPGALFPGEFMRQPPVPEMEPDKKAIKAALESGREIDGARLQRGQRIEIKQ